MAKHEYLVALQKPLAAAERSKLFKNHNAVEVEKIGSTELYLVRLAEGSNAEAFVKALGSDPRVRYVEPNLMLQTFPKK